MKPPDHHVIAGLHKATSADVAQERIAVSAEIVSFNQSDAHGLIYAAYNCGVIAWWQLC